jgi:FkbM family methyltransferase
MSDTASSAPEHIDHRKSYAIEAEDLLIANAWANLIRRPLLKGGVYLDLGASHPVNHSNTYYFYEHGWGGICVEANPELCALYAQFRPRDKVCNIGVAPAGGTLTYHRFQQYLNNGFLPQKILDEHRQRGQIYLGHVDIECVAIGDFLKSDVAVPIDILNIDVETMEPRILGAWDWQACRPKLICVEIHSRDIRAMLKSDVTVILERNDYTPVSRGLISTLFVDNALLK